MTLCFKIYLTNPWEFLPVDLKNIPQWVIRIPWFLLILCLYEGYRFNKGLSLSAHGHQWEKLIHKSGKSNPIQTRKEAKNLLEQSRPRIGLYSSMTFTQNCSWYKSFLKFHLHNGLNQEVCCLASIHLKIWVFQSSVSQGCHLCLKLLLLPWHACIYVHLHKIPSGGIWSYFHCRTAFGEWKR